MTGAALLSFMRRCFYSIISYIGSALPAPAAQLGGATSMTKPLLAVLASGFLLVGCTQNLSKREVFRSTIGKELITQRPTYIYNFESDGYYELWDELYEYGTLARSGVVVMKVERPLYVVPTGASLTIRKVVRTIEFDNPPRVEARGVLRLEGRELPITYVWGGDEGIHKAPWESPKYKPGETRSIKPGRAPADARLSTGLSVRGAE